MVKVVKVKKPQKKVEKKVVNKVKKASSNKTVKQIVPTSRFVKYMNIKNGVDKLKIKNILNSRSKEQMKEHVLIEVSPS